MIRNNNQNRRRRGGGGNNGPRPQQMNGGGNSYGNRLDNRQRGNASQLLEKYKAMARDAQQAGDRVAAEYYLQYADHYYRVLGDYRERQPEQNRQRGANFYDEADGNGFGDGERDDGDDGDGSDGDRQQDYRSGGQGANGSQNGQLRDDYRAPRQAADDQGEYRRDRGDDRRPQRDAQTREGQVREGQVREGQVREGQSRDTGPRDAGLRDAGVRDAGSREGQGRDAAQREAYQRDGGRERAPRREYQSERPRAEWQADRPAGQESSRADRDAPRADRDAPRADRDGPRFERGERRPAASRESAVPHEPVSPHDAYDGDGARGSDGAAAAAAPAGMIAGLPGPATLPPAIGGAGPAAIAAPSPDGTEGSVADTPAPRRRGRPRKVVAELPAGVAAEVPVDG